MKKKIKNKSGFSLVEMIVSITIIILIVGAIYSLYVFHQYIYQKGEEAEEILQNGRVIIERLSRELRQTREIVTQLPDVRDNPEFPPPDYILFQDGHLPLIVEEETAQAGTQNTISLFGGASPINDYYKGMFIKIISGPGEGEIKKIIEYNATTKVATIKGSWSTIPQNNSVYRIDTNYYYIRYFKDNNNLKRQVIVYYFSGSPNFYVPWNAEPPEGETLENQVLEDDIIGEYVTSLEFWGRPLINIVLTETKGERSLNLYTKVIGRNL